MNTIRLSARIPARLSARLLVPAVLSVCGLTSAFAATNMPRVDARQANQEQRIQQGVNSGQVTAREAGRLETQQGRITQAQAQAQSDGRVTAAERQKLTKMQNNASRNIHKQKHDAQRQPRAQS